jgi:hypothetical protein
MSEGGDLGEVVSSKSSNHWILTQFASAFTVIANLRKFSIHSGSALNFSPPRRFRLQYIYFKPQIAMMTVVEIAHAGVRIIDLSNPTESHLLHAVAINQQQYLQRYPGEFANIAGDIGEEGKCISTVVVEPWKQSFDDISSIFKTKEVLLNENGYDSWISDVMREDGSFISLNSCVSVANSFYDHFYDRNDNGDDCSETSIRILGLS